jgi:hypothetical protein
MANKVCNNCGTQLTLDNWIFATYKHKNYKCDDCRKITAKQYNKENSNKIAQTKQLYRRKLKIAVLNHYGDSCNECGEDNFYYLTIDHINNDGNIDRKNGLSSGHNFYHWLIKNNFPPQFRTLCFNCNCSTSVMEDHKNSNPNYTTYKNKLKSTIINAYGGKCNFCSHSIFKHLTIDHINGITEKDKPRSSIRLYKYLIENNFPTDNFQLLCYNCNCAKYYYNYYGIKEING